MAGKGDAGARTNTTTSDTAKKAAAPAAQKAASATGAAKKTATAATGKTAVPTKRATRQGGTPGLPVLEKEDPWTPAEIAEVQAELEQDRDRLQAEVDEAEADLAELMRDSGEGSGDDQADAGAATWEREHELSLTNNAKELLEQIEHALERIGEGTYGTCESCGNPIGKMRLQAFPRATLCLSCKQKQERR
ncbi:TraR/DksA family transcriptional regulator [Ornithinimicrobium ciconiae]|uniref:TraR/DksA family transcriptional regulator n=1 Tax=Ornithinimicrobium ciconiae TaxID=2594265 RepID=A0A516G9X3_9MICO|nr:TraR/DksA family transcriptional regulator [Ornithinimicrobium ciconiae]QDO88327.1 TraR/DksA family transcriptional regulator [Ornithinimicrobium ciconiae]